MDQLKQALDLMIQQATLAIQHDSIDEARTCLDDLGQIIAQNELAISMLPKQTYQHTQQQLLAQVNFKIQQRDFMEHSARQLAAFPQLAGMQNPHAHGTGQATSLAHDQPQGFPGYPGYSTPTAYGYPAQAPAVSTPINSSNHNPYLSPTPSLPGVSNPYVAIAAQNPEMLNYPGFKELMQRHGVTEATVNSLPARVVTY